MTTDGPFKLYDFQEEDVQRMMEMQSYLLANDMGTGKTVVQLEEIRRRLEQREGYARILVVCPKSVIPVWTEHIKTFFPDAAIYERHVPTHPAGVQPELQFVVTNWDQIRISPAYKTTHWLFVIGDEIHYAKNRKAQRTKALWTIPATYRRGLSGTPMVNRPDELWAILKWLKPELFRSYWKFFNEYVQFEKNPYHGYIEVKGAKNVDQLRKLMNPFFSRRKKEDVLKELPDKYYETILVDLDAKQRRIYREMKSKALAWIGEHENEPLPARMVVAQLMRLRQFCAAYADIDDDGRVRLMEPSSKLDALMELLESTDESVVVFTNFRGVVRLASARMTKAGISHVTLTGETPQEERGQAIDAFQSGKVRVFIGTIRAGGVGVTLTRASTVVFLDRSFSPADNLQAEDRLHRIGQSNAVQVVSIQARGTVDQVVEEKLKWKWDIIKSILEN